MLSVFVGVGSNLGDRRSHVRSAHRALEKLSPTGKVDLSPIYETDPVGPAPQGKYLNAVARLETTLEPDRLLAALQAIEHQAGRAPLACRPRWRPRTLDLDVLLYGDRVIDHGPLVVPHPLMHRRWFVLKPLADLDPLVLHPRLGMTAGQLLARLEPLVQDAL